MGDVISLKQPEPRIWVCGCGCCTFEMYEDGSARCAMCDGVAGNGGWMVPDTDEVYTGNAVTVVRGNDDGGEIARRRLLRAAGTARLVIAAQDDGALSTWSTVETQDQFDWVMRRLEHAKDLFTSQWAEVSKDLPSNPPAVYSPAKPQE